MYDPSSPAVQWEVETGRLSGALGSNLASTKVQRQMTPEHRLVTWAAMPWHMHAHT